MNINNDSQIRIIITYSQQPALESHQPMSITLNELAIGTKATIHSLLGHNPSLHRQCGALGLKPGVLVQVLHRHQRTGPMQIKCRGTLFSIRSDEAAFISVSIQS
ncbi:FeoA family protein [Teredinibacter purpureus]|uniref:FeoA family protein n=1 Tax=Teredinibacter purpureus TaxID=2731756 RepID=UPI000A5172F1|nr:FeoA family protein [Teredinibacter purpureus]